MDRTALLCRNISERPEISQRELALALNVSLGTVNKLVRNSEERGLIAAAGGQYRLTEQGREYLRPFRVDGALIMAAGFGSRFVPLTFETPKGLLEVFGERMIERQIRQLHQAGIRDITIAVGYLKEKFEYLIDKYGVKLLYNPEYSTRNNLATVYHAREILYGRNMYLLSSDNWMRENLFHTFECGSWYSSVYKEGETSEWCLSHNRKGKILGVTIGGRDCWVMYGPVFLSSDFLADFLPVLEQYYHTPGTESLYWENVYLEMLNGAARRRLGASAARRVPELYLNFQPSNSVYEFENLEELRRFDPKYRDRSDNRALQLISRVFRAPESEICGIRCVKSGVTNRSFLFRIRSKAYVCRIPGPDTGRLVDRRKEARSLEAVAPLDISEKVVYFDGRSGYKIAEYCEGARVSDPQSEEDTARCMELLRRLHTSGITVEHTFDIRERISFFENLCGGRAGIPFEDYPAVKAQMTELMDRLDRLDRPKTFCHVDSAADNYLFLPDGQLKMIDLEYAGMCDGLIDVAMRAVFSRYDDLRADRLLRLYLRREPTEEERTVFCSYAALGGFLWSLWAVYESSRGQEFGEYTIVMYRCAKRFYRRLFPAPGK